MIGQPAISIPMFAGMARAYSLMSDPHAVILDFERLLTVPVPWVKYPGMIDDTEPLSQPRADRPCVIWDFDGTLLPALPYDSEQALMRALMMANERPRPLVKRLMTPMVVEADRRRWFTTARRRQLYLHLYPWLLAGTPDSFLERFARETAHTIAAPARRCIADLKNSGHPMVVVSCGTADLSERVLRLAGVGACFDWVAGNRLRFSAGKIIGLDIRLPTALSKVECVRRAGIDLAASAVVGDGYTDLPLLERAKIPVMIDPYGEQRRDLKARGYHFVAGVCEAAAVICKQVERAP